MVDSKFQKHYLFYHRWYPLATFCHFSQATARDGVVSQLGNIATAMILEQRLRCHGLLSRHTNSWSFFASTAFNESVGFSTSHTLKASNYWKCSQILPVNLHVMPIGNAPYPHMEKPPNPQSTSRRWKSQMATAHYVHGWLVVGSARIWVFKFQI